MSKGIIANSVMNAAAGMLLLLTGFVSSIITARLLGPEANGIVAFSLWLVMTGASIAELGSSITLLKTLPQLSAEGYDARRRRGFAAILVSFMMFSTVALLALYALFFLTSEEMHWAETAPSVALVTGALFFIQAIGSFVKFYLIGEKKLGTFFKLTVAVSIIQLAGVATGAVLYGVEGVLVGYALGQLVLFFATLPILLARRDWCGVSLKYLASSSIILSIQFIIDSIFLNRLELLFLQQFWSVEMVGYYAVGLSIANIALQLPIQMTGSLLPYYSERRHSSDDSTLPVEVFAAVTRSMAYIVLPMSLGLAAISSELVLVVFGEAFRRSGTVVALLALVAPAYTFMQILSLYLLSMDKARSRLNISVIGGLLMVAGCLLIVPRLAAEGAAIVRILVFVAMSVMMIRQTGFGSQLSGLYASLTKVTLASVLCACAAISVLEFVHGPIGLILAIIAGTLAHFAALRVLRAVPLEDVEVMRSIVEKMPSALRRPVGRVIDFIAPGRPGDPDRAKVAPGELSLEPAEGAGRSAALPVVFDGTIGLFMPENPQAGKRSAAVLFVSPWGFEEMCSRKFFRVAAEHFSDIGVPSLRFDYRGTGDALDFGALPARLETWENSIRAAAAKLKSLTGCDRIILIGQGLGATLAQRIGSSIEGVDSLVMLAPVLSGRAYLRELNMWSKIIDADLGLGHEHVQAAKVQIAGLVMPEEIAAELGKLNIVAPQELAASRYLILERPVRAEDTGFADALQALGANVEQKVFDGYDELVTNPLFAKTPMDVVELLTAWLKTATAETSAAHSPATIETIPLAGDGFLETPVRFGSHDHLVGVVSRPLGEIKGNAVLFLSTAYDRHAGWGRTTVDMARELARHGVVSLRFDSANVGDSPPRPDAPEQVLYSMTQTDDAIAALDLLESVVAGPVMVAGRCSGGYVAFRAGVADERLKAVVSINPFVYYWDPKVPVRREHVVSVPRSLDDYGQRLARLDTLKRLLRGQVDVVSALRNIVIAGGRRLSPFVAPLLELLPDRRHIAREVRQSFALFGRRKVPLTLIYSEGDVGLDHVYFHFGPRGARLSRYPNVRLLMLPDADHNLTPPQSRKFVLDEIIRLARVEAGLS